jgi:hypothetical protein
VRSSCWAYMFSVVLKGPMVAKVLVALAAGLGLPATAAAQHCGRVKLAGGGKAKVRIVHGDVGCGKARLVIKSAYHAEASRHWDGTGNYGVYWRVRGFQCSIGLGGSETFCRRGSSK